MAETEQQRIARLVAEVRAGRSLTSIRQSVDRIAGLPIGSYGNVNDDAWLTSDAQIEARIRQIFGNRKVPLTTYQPGQAPAAPAGPKVENGVGGIEKPPGAPPPPPLPNASDLERELSQRNTYEAVTGLFKTYGLESLAPKILEFVQQGYDGNTISLLLQETPEYKQRFKGNEARVKNGLSVLDPASYISLERQYRQVMQSFGVPPGFYDQPADYHRFIEGDVSPAEVAERAQTAFRLVSDTNSPIRQALAQYYPELTSGDLVANLLDPTRAMPLIQKKIQAVEIGAAARAAGLAAPDRRRAEQFADRGVGYEEAQRAYGEIGGFLKDTSTIAQRFGEAYTQRDAEDETLGGMASQRRKRERLYEQEQSLFGGGSGVGRSSLSRRTGGSY